MIKKWRENVDKSGAFGALLTDLSKAFDCLPHELLIAKPHAHGLNMKSLNLTHDYFSNKKLRIKLGGVLSSLRE